MKKYNLFSKYPQCNHIHKPTVMEWVHDGSGLIDFFVDDAAKIYRGTGKKKVVIMVEPRSIQPEMYEWMLFNSRNFDLIFTHDLELLKICENARPINFMNWYESYDVTKTKNISMVCSDKIMCREHSQRQAMADILGDRVDHYGQYRGLGWSNYYECRAEYRFEVVIDNYWSGYWASEKLANALASKTVPIYLGGEHLPKDLNPYGIIRVRNIEDIPDIVDMVLERPEELYHNRLFAINENYKAIQKHKIFEDWLFTEYKTLLEGLE